MQKLFTFFSQNIGVFEMSTFEIFTKNLLTTLLVMKNLALMFIVVHNTLGRWRLLYEVLLGSYILHATQ